MRSVVRRDCFCRMAGGTASVRTALRERAGSSCSISWPPRDGTQNAGQSPLGRRVHPCSFLNAEVGMRNVLPRSLDYFFPGTVGHGTKLRPMGQTESFSKHGGTAGQSVLNIIDTIINCPTKVSHFRDQWDKKSSECKLQLVSSPGGRTS
jgi:hypothetical protein